MQFRSVIKFLFAPTRETKVRLSRNRCLQIIEEKSDSSICNFVCLGTKNPYYMKKSGFGFPFVKQPDFYFKCPYRKFLPFVLGYIKSSGEYSRVSMTLFPPSVAHSIIWLVPFVVLSRAVMLRPHMIGGAVITGMAWGIPVGLCFTKFVKAGLRIIKNTETLLLSAST
jgi:hypothetical protein